VDARKTFLLKALLSSRSGDDCCVIRPLVRGLCIESEKAKEIGKVTRPLSNAVYAAHLGNLLCNLDLKVFFTHVTFTTKKDTEAKKNVSQVLLAKSLWKLSRDAKFKGSQSLFKDSPIQSKVK
jgi:hypothetical protein